MSQQRIHALGVAAGGMGAVQAEGAFAKTDCECTVFAHEGSERKIWGASLKSWSQAVVVLAKSTAAWGSGLVTASLPPQPLCRIPVGSGGDASAPGGETIRDIHLGSSGNPTAPLGRAVGFLTEACFTLWLLWFPPLPDPSWSRWRGTGLGSGVRGRG